MPWFQNKIPEKALFIVVAAFVMIVASLLRFHGIGEQSLWNDEIISLNLSTWPTGTILIIEDGFPPLYALIMKAVFPWLATDFCGRIISAVFGVASVGLILWLGVRLYDLRTGILVAVLLTLSPLHVWYSREGRMYALLTFWSILSSLFVENLTEKGRLGSRASFCIATFGGILTHYAYAGVIVAQGLYLLLKLRRRKINLRLIFFGCVSLIITSIAVYPIVREAIIYWPLGSLRELNLLALPYTVFAFVAGFGIGPPLDELHRNTSIQTILDYWPEVSLVVITGAIIVIAGLRALYKHEGSSLYVLLWLIVPPLVAFSVSWVTGVGYNVRYVITSLPAFLFVVALGITRHGRVFKIVTLGALIVVSVISIARDRFDPRYAREEMRSTANYLQTEVEEGDKIVLSAITVSVALKHYYKGPEVIESLPIKPVRTSEDAAQVLRKLTERPETTWLLLVRNWVEDSQGLLKNALAKSNHAKLTAEFPGVKIYRISR